MTDYLKLVSGRPTLTAAVASSAGAGDAGKIPKLDAGGKIDTTMMPAGIGADSQTFTASEALTAGNLVNIHGTSQVRKADASNDRPAMGFVTAGVSNGAVATVFFSRLITGLSGLTIGARYWLSDSAAGGISATPPTAGAGKINQEVGYAVSSTSLAFEPQDALLLG